MFGQRLFGKMWRQIPGHAQVHQQRFLHRVRRKQFCSCSSGPASGTRAGQLQQHEFSEALHPRNLPARQFPLNRHRIINKVRLPQGHG
jgi:hypothetical protein